MKLEHDERCPKCGKKLELRMICRDSYIFYCYKCLEHHVKGVDGNEDRDRIRRSS